jgi:acetyl-CoA carboxylase biotin carboxylase subunit
LAITGNLDLDQSQIQLRGAAIEARILAEDPDESFLPTSGEISYLKEPGGPGIRVDSALYQGMVVTAEYDSLVSKLIAWGSDRKTAINRLQRGLSEYQIGGLKTDLIFLNQILESHPYQTGEITTSFLDDFTPEVQVPDESVTRDAAIAAALHIHQKRKQQKTSTDQDGNLWQQTAWREQISPSA